MKQSNLFTKTRKEPPSDEVSKNAQLLIQAGYIHKEMAGVYSFLPLGLKVLENIKEIIRGEMKAVDSQELIMTNLQDPEVWKTTNRWSDEKVDVWFKTALQDETKLGLAWSHEEPIMQMMQNHINSYKDLPASVFQFQTKLRNELRAKSGIMRGREFVMKDMYSLHTDEEDMNQYYEQAISAYESVYERLGLGEDTFITFAGGGAFTKFSHEFQTICEAGEDTLYINKDKSVAVNEEVLDEATEELSVKKEELNPVTSAEVGNIFKFGTEKSEKMDVHFVDKDNQEKPIYLASYGIGVTRVMGVIAEKFSDEDGLVWPENISPYDIHLISLSHDKEEVDQIESIYQELKNAGMSVLYDDRKDAHAGEKFADSDLMGINTRVILSDSNLQEGKAEIVNRKSGETDYIPLQEITSTLNKKYVQ
ncbi:MAG: proline--tRNA ligase [Candidatus Magasanikbacteria bacterium]